ncbi:hypothetical protein B0H10DRAFT_4842 [Mycena sp. CBHHK59/15]|nr:hypothetical protein B0H10DRAFT_4842 [Mycena sp. CBHHK59/15]
MASSTPSPDFIPLPPPRTNWLAVLQPSITLVMIGTVFTSFLVPMLIALLFFSTTRSRRLAIFHLNILAIIMGIVEGILNAYCEYPGPWSTHSSIPGLELSHERLRQSRSTTTLTSYASSSRLCGPLASTGILVLADSPRSKFLPRPSSILEPWPPPEQISPLVARRAVHSHRNPSYISGHKKSETSRGLGASPDDVPLRVYVQREHTQEEL